MAIEQQVSSTMDDRKVPAAGASHPAKDGKTSQKAEIKTATSRGTRQEVPANDKAYPKNCGCLYCSIKAREEARANEKGYLYICGCPVCNCTHEYGLPDYCIHCQVNCVEKPSNF